MNEAIKFLSGMMWGLVLASYLAIGTDRYSWMFVAWGIVTIILCFLLLQRRARLNKTIEEKQL